MEIFCKRVLTTKAHTHANTHAHEHTHSHTHELTHTTRMHMHITHKHTCQSYTTHTHTHITHKHMHATFMAITQTQVEQLHDLQCGAVCCSVLQFVVVKPPSSGTHADTSPAAAQLRVALHARHVSQGAHRPRAGRRTCVLHTNLTPPLSRPLLQHVAFGEPPPQ